MGAGTPLSTIKTDFPAKGCRGLAPGTRQSFPPAPPVRRGGGCPASRRQMARIEQLGLSGLPVCIAKTQYSFSQDPKRYGAPSGFNFEIKDIIINTGAEMIVAIAGDIIRMPGLPKEPQALHIDIVDGQIEGLS